MSGNFTWKSGKDGTQYYVDSANGHIAGMVQTAGNGSDIFKIGFGVEFVALYDKEVNAKTAVEKIAHASSAARNLKATKNLRKSAAKSRTSNKIAK